MVFVLILCSLALSFSLTPIAARLATQWGFVDRPANHKYHAQSTPLLGGLALYLGLAAPLLMLLLTRNIDDSRLWIFLGAATVLFLVGLWDDWRHLSVRLRLAAQLAVALTLLLADGLRPELPLPEWTVWPIGLLWIVGITNAINLLDSMDGVASGISAVAAAGFLILGSNSPITQALAAALLGTSLGFLPHNFHRARVFMGDAGSLVLGFSLATLGLVARFEGVEVGKAWMLPVLILTVPIFDTTLVSWSRLRQGKNPLTHPGKDHFAHRLTRCGLGIRGAVFGLYALGMIGGLLALLICQGAMAWGVGLVSAMVMTGGLAWLERPALISD